ncbi:MAG: hypothetical protein IPG91_02050 [Ideonella sp.]|nr:hypothetical protein [Ideonella sp.]
MSGALQTADISADASGKAWALRAIAEERAEAGDAAGAAAQTRELALQTAATITDASDKAYALHAIAQAQAKASDVAGATRTWERAMAASAAELKRRHQSILEAEHIALMAADRVDAGDLSGTLAWAAAQGGNPVARFGALVGASVALLRPSSQLGQRSNWDLLALGFMTWLTVTEGWYIFW